MAIDGARHFGNGDDNGTREDGDDFVRPGVQKILTALAESDLTLSARMSKNEAYRSEDRRLLDAIAANVAALTNHNGLVVTHPAAGSLPPMREKFVSVSELPNALVEIEDRNAGQKWRKLRGRMEGAAIALFLALAAAWIRGQLHIPEPSPPSHEGKP